MKALILLERLQVENANAIAGITWGFPAISHFLGYGHALSRKLQEQFGVSLGGCAVICHDHQVHAHQPGGWEWVFALTRNPLTKEGATAPFVEEGRMHFNASLLLECHFDALDLCHPGEAPSDAIARLCALLQREVPRQRLAGGTIVAHGAISLIELDADFDARSKTMRRQLLRLLPGFALIERRDWLAEHHHARLALDPQADLLDSLLDFVALQQLARSTLEGVVEWAHKPKPHAGYLVPIACGYQAISPLYEAGEVANVRDPSVPFRFVESIYTLGEWRSPHRYRNCDEMAALFWRYQQTDDLYLCCTQPLGQTAEASFESNL